MTGADDIAVLRIELEDIEPLIWRRAAVRSDSLLSKNDRAAWRTIEWAADLPLS